MRDYVQRYQQIYERLFPSMQRRVDWAGPVIEQIEQERRAALPADQPCRAASAGATAG